MTALRSRSLRHAERGRARVLIHPRVHARFGSCMKTLAAAAGERRSSTHVTHRRLLAVSLPEVAVPSRRGSRLDYQQVSRAQARPVGIVDDPRPLVRSVCKPSYIPPLTRAPYVREKLKPPPSGAADWPARRVRMRPERGIGLFALLLAIFNYI